MTKWKLNLDSYKCRPDCLKCFLIGLKYLLIITLPLLILFVSVYPWMFNEQYFVSQFEKNNVYSIYDKDLLLEENRAMLNYLEHGAGDIDSHFFSAQDKIHLVEVRDLMQSFVKISLISIISWLILVISLKFMYKKDLFEIIHKGGLVSLGIGGVILVIFLNFEYFFTQFHLLFFDGFNWILNENVDKLINMFPLTFFINITIRIMLTYFTISLILTSLKKVKELVLKKLNKIL